MRLLIVAERLEAVGGTERYLDVVGPLLRARTAALEFVTRKALGWADEHDVPCAAAATAMTATLRTFRPDAVVAHNVMDAGVVEVLRRAPRFVYHVHDHRPFCPNGDRLFPRRRTTCALPIGAHCVLHALLDGCGYGARPRTLGLIRARERLRSAIAAADAVIVASEYMRDRTVASGIDPERVTTLPLPLPDDAYASSESSPQRVVAFAGRIVPQKGLSSLVEALGRISPERRPRLRAFGDGPALAQARARAARDGVVIEAPGEVDRATIERAFDEAALVVLPSLWSEPFGYVGIEAFARARTVVAYAVGGVTSWLVEGRNGSAVPRGDTEALAAAIERLLDESVLRREMERNARTDAESFRAEPIVGALMTTYRGGA